MPKGVPRTEKDRAAISAGLRAYHARVRKELDGYPNQRRCSVCKTWKAFPREFGWRKKPLADGTINYLPRSHCKACSAKRAKAYYYKLKKEGRLRGKQRIWERNRRKRNKKNAYKATARERLPAQPIADWLATKPAPAALDELDPKLRRRIDALKAQEYATVQLATVDAIASVYGEPGLVSELYPE